MEVPGRVILLRPKSDRVTSLLSISLRVKAKVLTMSYVAPRGLVLLSPLLAPAILASLPYPAQARHTLVLGP